MNLDFGYGKKNELFDLISPQTDIDKIYLNAKDPYEAKYQLLINKYKGADFKYCKDSKAYIEYSNIWMILIKILKNTIQMKIPNK